MAQRTITFDEWSLGDAGRRRPSRGPGLYRGVNVLTFPSGGVGPRPPFVRYALSPDFPAGRASLCYYGGETWTVLCFDAGAIWTFGSGTTTSHGTSTSPIIAATHAGSRFYGCKSTAGGYFWDAGVPGATAVPAMPAGSCLAVYGDFLVLAELGGKRLRWSAPADFLTWPAANFLDVGNHAITDLVAQGSSLAIQNVLGEWWTLSGAPGPSAVLRRQSLGRPPWDQSSTVPSVSCLTPDNVIWFKTTDIHSIGMFTGSRSDTMMIPDFPEAGFNGEWLTNIHGIASLGRGNDIAVVGASKSTSTVLVPVLLTFIDGRWNRHQLPITLPAVSGETLFVVPSFQAAQDRKVRVITRGSSTENVKVWDCYIDSEFPSTERWRGTADGQGAAGAVVNGSIDTGEWWHPEAKQVRVLAVIVDVDYDLVGGVQQTAHPTYGTTSPSQLVHMKAHVDALNRLDVSGDNESTTVSWTPKTPPIDPTAQPFKMSRTQAVFRVGDQGAGTGFRVSFTEVRGLVIHRVTAIIDEMDARY